MPTYPIAKLNEMFRRAVKAKISTVIDNNDDFDKLGMNSSKSQTTDCYFLHVVNNPTSKELRFIEEDMIKKSKKYPNEIVSVILNIANVETESTIKDYLEKSKLKSARFHESKQIEAVCNANEWKTNNIKVNGMMNAERFIVEEDENKITQMRTILENLPTSGNPKYSWLQNHILEEYKCSPIGTEQQEKQKKVILSETMIELEKIHNNNKKLNPQELNDEIQFALATHYAKLDSLSINYQSNGKTLEERIDSTERDNTLRTLKTKLNSNAITEDRKRELKENFITNCEYNFNYLKNKLSSVFKNQVQAIEQHAKVKGNLNDKTRPSELLNHVLDNVRF